MDHEMEVAAAAQRRARAAEKEAAARLQAAAELEVALKALGEQACLASPPHHRRTHEPSKRTVHTDRLLPRRTHAASQGARAGGGVTSRGAPPRCLHADGCREPE